jgi:indoleamine 2,3-dioxygenase
MSQASTEGGSYWTPGKTGRGFLPGEDPCPRLPASFEPWDALALELPGLLAAGRAREYLSRLPLFDPRPLEEPRHLERAMQLLSFFGHAAVWEKGLQHPELVVPRSVAVPWVSVARRLGRPPVLSYASHGLNNWRRIDPAGPIALGNLSPMQVFLGGLDESWFILVHVDIEARAAPIVDAATAAQQAVTREDSEALERALRTVIAAQREVQRTLARMPERCDPSIFFSRVQPFLHGFLETPLRYEGVQEFGDQPQAFAGASAAQSMVMPLLDAVLGVKHSEGSLNGYLVRLRSYMPSEHLRFIASVDQGPSVRDFILSHREPALVEAYNGCLELLRDFRQQHMELSARYILQPAREQAAARGETGTGGTPFTHLLRKHREETERYLIS